MSESLPENPLPTLVELTYSSTTDPSHYEELLAVWEGYMERIEPNEIEDAKRSHLQHFNRALEIFDKIGRQKQIEERQDAITALFDTPAFVIDAGGKILQGNRDQNALLLRSEDSELASLPALDDAFAALKAGAPVALIPVYGENDDLRDCAVLTPLPSQVGQDPSFLVTFSETSPNEDKLRLLQSQFNLSASETEVLGALLKGDTVAEITERRGVSTATTRTQVRQLLEKTGSGSLNDLTLKVSKITAQVSAVEIARTLSDDEAKSAISYERMFTADGRLVAYRQFGDPNGRPVLFIHNMMGGAIWPEQMEQMAKARNWRIIGPSRPGFGLSDSYPAKDMELVRRTCSDMRALLDVLEIDKALVIALNSSAGLGLKFAQDHSDRTQAVINFHYAGLVDQQAIESMGNPIRAMAKTYQRSPTALRFLVRVAVASVDMFGPERLLRSNFRGTPHDEALLDDPSVMSALSEGLKHAIAQGGEAFSRDGFVALTDFSSEARSLTCPALCVLGAEDSLGDPLQTARMIEDIPGYDLEIVEGAGQHVFYQMPELSFDRMERLWAADV